MLNSKENISHQNYTDGISNTKRMILMSEFILENDFEELFSVFLMGLNQDSEEWLDFRNEIRQLISEFLIDEEDVIKEMKHFIKVKPIPVC